MALLITYLVVAIGVSFICSILEAVLLSVTPTFVAQKLKENKQGAKKLAQVRDKLDHSISSILILNTFAAKHNGKDIYPPVEIKIEIFSFFKSIKH